MKNLAALILVLALASCAGGSDALSNITTTASSGDGGTDTSSSEHVAPEDLTDHAYEITVTAGTGIFPETGTYTLVFPNSSEFIIYGDGENTQDGWGTYTYIRNGNKGTMYLQEVDYGPITASVTYHGQTSGEYKAFLGHGSEDEENCVTGEFVELSTSRSRIYEPLMAAQ